MSLVQLAELPDEPDPLDNEEVSRIRSRAKMTSDGRTRPRTVARKYLTKQEKEVRAYLNEHQDEFESRPRTLGECRGGMRPCPFVACTSNLYLDVNPDSGAIKLNHPALEPHEVDPRHSCVHDIVDDNPNGITLEEAGARINLTRERIRQLEVRALLNARASDAMVKP